MKTKFLPIYALILLMAACSAPAALSAPSTQTGYQMISVDDLHEHMQQDDLLLINVHIPWEGDIPGTHAAIPYNDIQSHLAQLPEDKSAPVYLYCRSDAMGHTAAQTLLDMGYRDVYNLQGGYIAWQAAGMPFGE